MLMSDCDLRQFWLMQVLYGIRAYMNHVAWPR